MAELIGKIVLTGGPCAGKTTALARIEEELTEKGYRVFIVSESATELIKGGIKPFGISSFDLLKFQELIFQYQLSKERIYDEAVMSLPSNEKCVIIYDRGIMDNKAYISDEQFHTILNKFNFKESTLLENYDMIIHLVTAADGKEEYYTLSNNTARSETVDEAIFLDRKTANAWIGHNNLKIIDNRTEFDEKLNRVMDCIHNLLGNPIPIKHQRKFEIDLEKSNLDYIINGYHNKVFIEQTYLKKALQDSKQEIRLRKKVYKDQTIYYYTVQRKIDVGLSQIVIDKKITEKDYYKIIAMYDEQSTIKKTRYSFVKNKQYFKLDIFEDNFLAILEIEPTNENQIINIPSELSVIKEVTNDSEYLNSSIAYRQKTLCCKRPKMKI